MGNVIDFGEWKRARLGVMTPPRRARAGQGKGMKPPTSNYDLMQLLELLRK